MNNYLYVYIIMDNYVHIMYIIYNTDTCIIIIYYEAHSRLQHFKIFE